MWPNPLDPHLTGASKQRWVPIPGRVPCGIWTGKLSSRFQTLNPLGHTPYKFGDDPLFQTYTTESEF